MFWFNSKNSYLKDKNDEYKKAKGTKKRAIKRKLKFEDYKNCLEVAQIENKINHLEKTKNFKQKRASTNRLI